MNYTGRPSISGCRPVLSLYPTHCFCQYLLLIFITFTNSSLFNRAFSTNSRKPSQSRRRRDSSPRGGASGVSARPTLDEQSFFISKTGVPCYRGQQLRNNILVKLLLALVAGHSFLRYIELSASSRKWPGLPKPLLQGEVARRRRDGEVVQRRACPL